MNNNDMNNKVFKKTSRATLSAAMMALWMTNGQAIAQPNSEQNAIDEDREFTIEEVIVTAQRRGQSILEVPVATTSISAADLERMQVDDIYDLMLASPSVSGIAGGQSSPLSNTPLRIRGVGTSGVNPGFESAVGMYVDEIYRSRPAVAFLTFFDMDGIDILRGPQGTLFGKNSTAGAILQRTAAPTIGEFEAYTALQYAEYNSIRAEGAVNVPVSDYAAVRISGLHNSTDGFFTQGGTNDDTIAENETQGLRVQYAATPNDDLNIRLTADWTSFIDHSNFARAVRFDNRDPNGLANTAFPALSLNTAIGGLGYYYWDPVVPGGVGAGEARPFDFVSGVSQKGKAEMDQYGLAAHIDYDINENIAFRSITSYRSLENDSDNGDWDFGPTAIAGTLDQVHEFDTISQEFLFNFSYDGLDIATGVHYFQEDILYERFLDVGVAHGIVAGGAPGDPVRANPNVPLQDIRYEQDENSLGIFTHLTYDLTDTLTIIGGARWNTVDKDVSYINLFGTPIEYSDAVENNLSFYHGRAQAATAFPWDASRTDEEFTYDIALQWRPSEHTQVYGKFSHGFKAGGFSMNVNAGTGLPDPNGSLVVDGRTFTQFTPENAAFNPEFVDTYEIGTRWNTSRGLISAAVFASDFSDLQLTTFDGDAFIARSVGSIDVLGFEFESSLSLTKELSLNAAFTLLDTELGDDVIGVPIGRSVAQAPDLAVSIGLDYTRDLSNGMVLTAATNLNYQSDTFLNDGVDCTNSDGDIVPFSQCDPSIESNRISLLEQDAYYVVNATLGLRISENYNVSLYCDNCLEEDYLVYAFNQPAQPGSIVGYAGTPRVVGLRLKFNL